MSKRSKAPTIEVTRCVVSYRAKECPHASEEGHNRTGTGPECTGDCTWLEGDSRELETPTTEVITPDAVDLERFEGDAIAWAYDYIRSSTDASEPSMSPIGDTVPAHAWLSGTYEDPYRGDTHVTETTVRLTDGWTDEQRAEVFRAVSA